MVLEGPAPTFAIIRSPPDGKAAAVQRACTVCGADGLAGRQRLRRELANYLVTQSSSEGWWRAAMAMGEVDVPRPAPQPPVPQPAGGDGETGRASAGGPVALAAPPREAVGGGATSPPSPFSDEGGGGKRRNEKWR